MACKTKIIATLGPASSDFATVSNLIQAGARIFRINCSHGTEKERIELIQLAKQASQSLNTPVAVMIDLQGPKIRIGNLIKPTIPLSQGQQINITAQQLQGDESTISIDFPDLIQYIQIGHRILLDDGKIELRVTQKHDTTLVAQVVVGGKLLPRKGANFPDTELPIRGLTDKDLHDLQIGLNHSIDAIALSYVRNHNDIIDLKQIIASRSPQYKNLPIIAKIEQPQALDHLHEILEYSDGVMVARGDLAIEISPARVPIVQKEIISTANRMGKYVITATQMLESMIENAIPTRAEASDVANAIFDGSDAVMLSAETSIGANPVLTVKTMSAIIAEAEKNLTKWSAWDGNITLPADDDSQYVIKAARNLSDDRDVKAVCVFTQSGRTAALLSKTRPNVPIYAFTPNPNTYSRLSLYWGVHSFLTSRAANLDEILEIIGKFLKAPSFVKANDQVVLICGYPVHRFRSSNLLMLHTID
ncbi:MAG: pyruvate kinase [Anaerolineales bacterium]